MMAIGIGARSTVTANDLAAAIAKAQHAAGRRADVIATFADARFVDHLSDIAKHADTLAKRLTLTQLRGRSAECQTTSQRSVAIFGVASIAEAAALAAAGPGSMLIVPRIICGHVTVAVAVSQSSDHPKVET